MEETYLWEKSEHLMSLVIFVIQISNDRKFTLVYKNREE